MSSTDRDAGTGGGSGAGGFDLSQFHAIFFEEAGENLEQFEHMLLEIDLESVDDETLNAIFRCAHSVKGGAATFGFADVAELTHEMETLLDKLRRHELAPTAAMVDVLLAAGDALRAQLARHQGQGDEVVDTRELLQMFREFSRGAGAPAGGGPPVAKKTASAPAAPAASTAPAAAATTAPQPGPAAAEAAAPGPRQLELTLGPLTNPEQADDVASLFREIPELGTIEPLDGGMSADGMRRFKVVTTSTDDELLDLFSFHVSREQARLAPLGPGYGFHEGAPGAPEPAAAAEDPSFGFFDGAPGAPAAAAATAATPKTSSDATESCAAGAATAAASPAADAIPGDSLLAEGGTRASRKPAAAAGASLESTTLRVSIEKVDQLINLVGELVITQAMLAQTGKQAGLALNLPLASGLADLERHTRDLQEAVMSIRMIPMSLVFNRFPRMLRDLASKLGKRVELVTQGEATELDKGLVEKITDPLTHLVRNSCDHGIELPAERLSRGKAEHGTITLAASHQGGSIVIEVRDDGRGLSRAKLLKKARERGLDAPDTLTDQEVYALIFAPGFSTADKVTDISGRGVGMDVVKKNITALGGTVEVDSAEGYGMSVRVRLPLTLAIMDGMSVGVGHERYILPLASVVESFQLTEGMLKTIGGSGRVVEVRGEYLPVVNLERVLEVPRLDVQRQPGLMVVAEAEGARAALLVDELLGQQQVVVKNLETHYRKVDNVSGATILGDGRVALILDVGALIRRARH